MLWETNLVMVDQETGSLWSQILGQSMRGPLVGTMLEQIPARMTTWRIWKAKHPQTTVFYMSRTSGVYDRGFLGPHRGVGIGMVEDGEPKFWDFGHLSNVPAVNDTLGDKLLLVVLDRRSLTPAIYSRRLDDRELHFQLVEGRLTDRETGSTWDLVTGQATDGELSGRYLEQLPGFTSDAAVWSLYFPNTNWWVPAAE